MAVRAAPEEPRTQTQAAHVGVTTVVTDWMVEPKVW